jgi:hypothetical protein
MRVTAKPFLTSLLNASLMSGGSLSNYPPTNKCATSKEIAVMLEGQLYTQETIFIQKSNYGLDACSGFSANQIGRK